MLEVGLMRKSNSIESPLVIPPRMPPALFDVKPSWVISSLISEPLSSKISLTLPMDTDFTALILIIALASSASNLSKTGSPMPTGQFSTLMPSFAPTEFPSSISSVNIPSNSFNF